MKNVRWSSSILFLFIFFGAQVFCATVGGPSKTKSFTVKKGGVLRVNLNGGDIHLTPWEKDEVSVMSRGAEEDADNSFTIKQRENMIIIQNDEDEGWEGDTRLDISLPSQFNVDLKTSQGSIMIDGPMIGELSGSTSAGDIRIGNVSGNVDMNTSGGDIRSGDVKGDLTLRTSGGDIMVGTVEGVADINTAGGNIRMKDVSKTLWAKTAGGDVEVGNIGGELTITTAGGNIVVGKVTATASLSTAGGDIELQAANGRVKAKTAGGNLFLYSITGSVEGKTSGGEIEVELTPKDTRSSQMITAGGNIHLYLPENAKATINATIRIQGRWKHAKNEYQIHSTFKAENYVVDDETREIRGTYLLNGGGEAITLETVNANIEIGKLGARVKRSSDD